MHRRSFLRLAGAAAFAGSANPAWVPGAAGSAPSSDFAALAAQMTAGGLTSERLTRHYLDRIQALDRRGPCLRAVLETNTRALDIAAALDRERALQGPRGPLHGIPILIKDNIETADRMMTTAGSLALQGWYAPKDAPLIERLRAAGAVILGKTNLSEWANFRSAHSSSGWSARGGQTRNPYALNRTPSGSSSGSAVAVAARLCAAAIGSETDGSIVSPASINGIVGLKPTVGLVSRRGIVPISHSQDTAGLLARSVHDAALLLGAISGPDPLDEGAAQAGAAQAGAVQAGAARASAAAQGVTEAVPKFLADYRQFLDPNGLQGARLGIARKFFAENEPMNAFLDRCIGVLTRAGAILVDPADLPMHGEWEAPELEVLLYEFKTDLNAYLDRLPLNFPVRSLEALIRFNEANAAQELKFFGQELLRRSQAKGDLNEEAYRQARASCLAATRANGIDALIVEHRLDAIVTLTSGPAWLIDEVNGDSDTGGCSSPAAIAGYPHITVPAGLHRGLPVGLSFFGPAFSEPLLVKLASGFEHAASPPPVPAMHPSI